MLETLIGGGLLGAASNVIGGLLDFGANKQANKQAKELAKYQYDLNMQAWREQTDYNKPINQVARLQEAGLNPQLAYGNGTQAGNATPAPGYQAPTLHRYQGAQTTANAAASTATTIYQTLLAAQKQKEELKLLDSQRQYNLELSNKARAEALLIASKRGGQDITNELLGFQREVQRETYDREVEAYNRDMELKDAELQLKGSQIDSLDAQTRYNMAKIITEDYVRRQYMAAIDNLYSQARLADSHGRLYSSQAEWQEERNKMKTLFTKADFAELSNRISLLYKQGRATEISNTINSFYEQRAKRGVVPYTPTNPMSGIWDLTTMWGEYIIGGTQ